MTNAKTETADWNPKSRSDGTPPAPHPYIGMWVTADGYIRQELLPNGRYDEARGGRTSAYTGRYTVTGSHIDYIDDTGFTATGDVRDGVLYHEHLVLYREGEQPARPSAVSPNAAGQSVS